ncbi:39S ribosomal protein L34, mitochondrial [Lemur catta]|uniref:39S ribosomal protein L34, mitochondrial n=1 Tax=Lemur catta TaxID=9447 RepID=UPI001E26C217|nr:39S ribosomal protein L34, mitochondrial [Lemur catta]
MVNTKNYTAPRARTLAPMVRRRGTTTSGPQGHVSPRQEKLHFPEAFARGLRNRWRPGRRDQRLEMAFLARSLLGPAGRSAALLGGRWLQPRPWLGLPDAWGLPALQQARGRARGNEYQPSNIKRKRKHGWIRRLSTPAGVQVILRRMLKGRKSLSH